VNIEEISSNYERLALVEMHPAPLHILIAIESSPERILIIPLAAVIIKPTIRIVRGSAILHLLHKPVRPRPQRNQTSGQPDGGGRQLDALAGLRVLLLCCGMLRLLSIRPLLLLLLLLLLRPSRALLITIRVPSLPIAQGRIVVVARSAIILVRRRTPTNLPVAASLL